MEAVLAYVKALIQNLTRIKREYLPGDLKLETQEHKTELRSRRGLGVGMKRRGLLTLFVLVSCMIFIS